MIPEAARTRVKDLREHAALFEDLEAAGLVVAADGVHHNVKRRVLAHLLKPATA